MKTRVQVFSCEICEIFKNKYFKEHLRTTASSGSSCLNIRAFDESSFPLSIYCYDNQKKSFSCFHGNHCLGKKFRHQNHRAYKSKLFPKDKRRKTAQENCCEGVTSIIFSYLRGFDRFNTSCFS